MDKLYTKIEKQSTLKEFLEKYFSYIKVYTSYLTGHATYSDEECTQLHCSAGKYRSFDDLLILVNTYYDDISVEELIKTLSILDMKYESKEYLIHSGVCGDIQRIRILFVPKSSMYISFDNTKYRSKYSWKELFAMIDIHSTTDYLKYRENYYKNLKEDEEIQIN